MKAHQFALVLSAITFFQLLIPVDLQEVQGRHYRPYQDKCDRGGRCSAKEDDTKEVGGRPKELTRDGYPSVTGVGYPGTGHDFKPKPDYEPTIVGGGYNVRPTSGKDDDAVGGYEKVEDDYDVKPVGYDYNLKPDNPQGGGGRGGYNRRTDRIPRPGSGGGGGYRPKPGGSGTGGYNPRPVDDTDDYGSKPVGGGGYIKPTGGRDEDELVGPGGYIKPTGGRDENKPVGGGDYIPKPFGGRDENKPGGYGYPSKEDQPYRRPVRPDHGGYNDPKGDDYNHKDDGVKDEDDESQGRPIPVGDGKCICVPYYQCKEGHIVTDGAGIIDARKKPEPEDSKELPLDGKYKPPSCGPYHVCCSAPETSTFQPNEQKCGVRHPNGVNSRILSPSNQGEADFGEWPWQAAVLKSEEKVNIFQCGGVLIDKYHVLTVAHCVFHLYQFNEYPLKVRLGEWDTQTTTEYLAHKDHKVSKIMVHPEFRNTSLWNDVAILRLEEPVFFAPHIAPVCLPQYDENFAGQNCVVTGWGKDAFKGGSFSNVMKEVAIGVIDNYKCEEMLRKTRLGRFFQLHEGFVCAGGEYGLDSCKGDGGGPLVCYRKDKTYALAGMVSWGIDCGQPGVPGVYVKTQKYLDWISKSTGTKLQEYWPDH